MTRRPPPAGLWSVASCWFTPFCLVADPLRVDLETNVHCRARAWLGVDVDEAVGAPDPVADPHHPESQAAAPVAAFPRLEQPRLVVLAHPDAGVLHGDHDERLFLQTLVQPRPHPELAGLPHRL